MDFVICDNRTLQPRLVVELDDATHKRNDRTDRDKFVDSAFATAPATLNAVKSFRSIEHNLRSIRVLDRVLICDRREELRRRSYFQLFTEGLFDKLAGFETFGTGESTGFDSALALGVDDDFDFLTQAAPPTLMVSLIDPLSSRCSTTECPFRRASIFVFSTA